MLPSSCSYALRYFPSCGTSCHVKIVLQIIICFHYYLPGYSLRVLKMSYHRYSVLFQRLLYIYLTYCTIWKINAKLSLSTYCMYTRNNFQLPKLYNSFKEPHQRSSNHRNVSSRSHFMHLPLHTITQKRQSTE